MSHQLWDPFQFRLHRDLHNDSNGKQASDFLTEPQRARRIPGQRCVEPHTTDRSHLSSVFSVLSVAL